MRRRRIYFGIGPLVAALLAALLGMEAPAERLALSIAAANLAALTVPEALRRAAARLPDMPRLRCTMLLSLLITAATAALGQGIADRVFEWTTLFGQTALETRCWIGAAFALTALRCLEEWLTACGDGVSATLADILTGIALSTAMLLYRTDLGQARACLVCALGILGLTAAIACSFQSRGGLRLNATLFREIPAALLRTGLYPALALLMVRLLEGTLHPAALTGFLTGWIGTELCRGSLRRGDSSASVCTVGIAAVNAITVAIFIIAGGPSIFPRMLLAAGGCALLLYVEIRWYRVVPAALSLIAVFSPLVLRGVDDRWGLIAVVALNLLLILPDWLDLFRRIRARHIRARAARTAQK